MSSLQTQFPEAFARAQAWREANSFNGVYDPAQAKQAFQEACKALNIPVAHIQWGYSPHGAGKHIDRI
jgi:hypothetical protein